LPVPREVFAEEIEAFLERLEAVAAARVVANDDGEIERIYVTTESTRDDGAIRRAITSALISQYGLPVDGWRVQVAHLEPQPSAEPIPACQLVRLEETLTETLARVVVDLRYEREGGQKTVTGAAQAPPGQMHRLRTVALATVEALRPLAERGGFRPSLEGVTLIPFGGATVALAAVSLAATRGTVLNVGAETVEASEAEAVVAAVIDAVRKAQRARPGQRPRPDRRRQFEGLRQHYERLLRADVPAPAPPAPRDAEAEAAGSTWATAVTLGAPPAAASAPAEAQAEAAPSSAASPAADDVIGDMSEIRPERQGGAPTVMREEARTDVTAGGRSGVGKLSVEDAFYRRLVLSAAPVHIRCRDGYEIPSAIVREYGTYSLIVEVNGVQELLFKHGIIAIRPHAPLLPEPDVTA
jgi:sRNA-binding regulator protein Hfq